MNMNNDHSCICFAHAGWGDVYCIVENKSIGKGVLKFCKDDVIYIGDVRLLKRNTSNDVPISHVFEVGNLSFFSRHLDAWKPLPDGMNVNFPAIQTLLWREENGSIGLFDKREVVAVLYPGSRASLDQKHACLEDLRAPLEPIRSPIAVAA